ncbi:MAG TPA: hypothetical protein VI413_10685 [Paludibacter sp.]
MRKLNCPQCEIHRFFVKNQKEETLLVNVTDQYDVVPVHPDQSLEGFDLNLLYCLGCSWKGSPKSLKNGSHKKRY